MRFKTNESVLIQDPEVVLRALETCLRDVSSEVVRYGDQITLHGLGPSPRAVNYQDTTVLSVSAEDDKTIINADVSFQASAFLGDVSQDDVVRSKLDQVFDQMRLQIDLESRRVAAGSEAPPAPGASPSSSSPIAPPSENGPIIAPAAPIAPAPVAPLETTEAPAEDLEAAVPLRMRLEAEEHWDAAEAAAVVSMLRREIQPEEESEPGHLKRWIWLVSAIVALFLLAGGVYLLRFRNRTVASRSAATVSQQSVATTAAPSPAVGERTVTKINEATIGPPPPPAPSSVSAPTVADPKVWLEEWAAAMRSRDPVAQASFYADPVNQYIDRRDVSNAVLVQAKRADIGRRHGLWTFTLHDVVVESRTPSEATVRAVKHYVVETEPAQVSEISVNTRLQLKVIDGHWKITSEQELRTPAAASVNPIDR